MIKLGMSTEDGDPLGVIVLGPGNLKRLKEGDPIPLKLEEILGPKAAGLELLITFTPDVRFVANFMKERPLTTASFLKALEEGKSRPEVLW